jgi:hypothetical protein
VNVFKYGNITNVSSDDKSVTYGQKCGVSETVSVSFIKNYNNCVNTTRGETKSQKECLQVKKITRVKYITEIQKNGEVKI